MRRIIYEMLLFEDVSKTIVLAHKSLGKTENISFELKIAVKLCKDTTLRQK